MREKKRREDEEIQSAEVKCPKCGRTQIIYIPREEVPKCPDDGTQMYISELLEEGKSS